MTLIYFFRVDGVEEIQYEISRIKQRSKSQFPELSLSILNCAFRPNCMFPAMLDLSMSSKSNPSIHQHFKSMLHSARELSNLYDRHLNRPSMDDDDGEERKIKESSQQLAQVVTIRKLRRRRSTLIAIKEQY